MTMQKWNRQWFIMAEVPSSLERIASRQSSFILFSDRVYAMHPHQASTDTVSVNGITMHLIPSLSFSDLEKQEDIIFGSVIEQYCSDFVKESINQELKAVDDIKKAKQRIAILKYIMNEFLPFLVSRRYANEDILLSQWEKGTKGTFDPVEQARQDITGKLLHDFGEAQTEEKADPAETLWKTVLKKEKSRSFKNTVLPVVFSPERYGIKHELSGSVLGEVTQHQALYILNDQVFRLIPEDADIKGMPVEKGMVFSINGKTYHPTASSYGSSFKEINDAVKERRQSAWKVHALERDQNIFAEIRSMIKAKDVRERHIMELAKLNEYDLGDCGFILRNGEQYYVFSRVPKFATQDGRNGKVFWPYDATRVAINITLEDGKIYSPEDPVVVEKREFHPCLSGRDRDGGFYHLCNLNRRSNSYTNNLLDMVRKLSDAANVIRQPMNKESLDSHSGHSYFGVTLTNILKQGSLTREEAITQGYTVVEVIPKTVTKTG
jgi:hypothetical protein